MLCCNAGQIVGCLASAEMSGEFLIHTTLNYDFYIIANIGQYRITYSHTINDYCILRSCITAVSRIEQTIY